MNYKAKIFFYSAALVLSVLIFACQGDILPPQNFVDVQLFDQRGFDYVTHFGYPNVSIGNYPIMLTDEFGKCHFENVNIPFDLSLSDYFTDSRFLFKDITKTNPAITLYFPGYNNNNNSSCHFRVYFPAASNGLGILKFISEDLFIQGSLSLTEYLSSGTYTTSVFIPKNKPSISGKFIYMKCSGVYNGGDRFYIYSFDNFGMKDVILYPGENNSVVFTPDEIQTSPNVTNFSFSTEIPQNSNPVQNAVYLSLTGYNRNSDIKIYASYYLHDQIIAPLDLAIPFQIKFESILYDYDYTHIEPVKYITCRPDTAINVAHSLINMDYPLNKQENINDNSVFSFSDNFPKGVYAINVWEGNPYSYGLFTTVFTDKNSIKWGEMKDRNFTPKPNTHYEWSVNKFSTFENIDDFLSSSLYDRSNFNSISSSNIKGFTTAP